MNNLLIDFYELTMGQAYFNKNLHKTEAYFDLFFRKSPDNAGYVIANGVSRCLKYLENFGFSDDDIEYLKSLNKFSDEYLDYLKTIKFTGDVYGVEDGTVVFPNEPVITIKAPLIEAQLVETALLLMFNRASLITTKTNRIVLSAKGRDVMEFGSRRAQGEDAAIEGALDAYIGGASGTACTLTGKKYNIPVMGTMAHSFVQSHDSELEAFKNYAETFPDSCVLLVDTYDTLKNGIPNAIKTYMQVLKPKGKKLAGIRIDSGNLLLLSKSARLMLNSAGLSDTKIVVSNSLDEYVISNLISKGAPIDSFGVGENLITSKSSPVFGGVYKLTAIEKQHKIIPKIKISDEFEKITNPHFKSVYRLYDKSGKIIADYLSIYNEPKPQNSVTLHHPSKNIKKNINNFEAKNIRVLMMQDGKLIYQIPSIMQTKTRVQEQLKTLKPEALSFNNPYKYGVCLSEQLKQLKNSFFADLQDNTELLNIELEKINF